MPPLPIWTRPSQNNARKSSDPLLSPPKPYTHRQRVLSDQEIKAFWKATEKLGYPYGSFYRLLLLTGQRRDEVAKLRWSEITDDVWTIPEERTKNNKVHIVHLSSLAQEILTEMIPTVCKHREYVFTTLKGGSTPICAFSKTKKRLDALMNRGARRTSIPPW